MDDVDCVIISDSEDEDSNRKVEVNHKRLPEWPRNVPTVQLKHKTPNGHAQVTPSKFNRIGNGSSNTPAKASNEVKKSPKKLPDRSRNVPQVRIVDPEAIIKGQETPPKANVDGVLNDSTVEFNEMLKYCIETEHTPQMIQIVAKIRKRFDECQQNFKNSDYLRSLIKEQHESSVKNKKVDKTLLKNVSDELSFHKIRLKRTNTSNMPCPASKKACVIDPQPGPSRVKSVVDEKELKKLKRREQFKRLQRSYKVVLKKIHALEKEEVNWDEKYEKDSAYIKEEKYKKRLLLIYNKMKEYSDEPLGSVTYRRKISVDVINYVALRKEIERFIKRQCANPNFFPDYEDIVIFIENASKELKLGLSPTALENFAKKAFISIGKQLQSLRRCELKSNLASLLNAESIDPADTDEELARKLKENKEKYKHREDDIMTQYVLEAESQRLRPEEVVEESSDGEDESESDESCAGESDRETPEKSTVDATDPSTDDDNDFELRLSSDSEDGVTKQHPISPVKNVGKPVDERFLNPVSPPYVSPLSSQETVCNESSQEIKPAANTSSFEEAYTRHINSLNYDRFGLEVKTKTFADAFTQHLLEHSDIESVKPAKSIEEELDFLDEDKINSKPPKNEESSVVQKFTKSERLVVSPVVMCDILPEVPVLTSQITIKKVQKARKSFPRSSVQVTETKPMQTPEITSSSNINDSDDDCIILD